MQAGYPRIKLKCTKPFDLLLPKYHQKSFNKRVTFDYGKKPLSSECKINAEFDRRRAQTD